MNAENPELVRRALDHGVRHLDTAYLYQNGKSESMIGEALEERGDRERVLIGTKMRFNRDRDTHTFTCKAATAPPWRPMSR
jgi:aryl-alcohol dehydrogenase-like predicted oxidoreductase